MVAVRACLEFESDYFCSLSSVQGDQEKSAGVTPKAMMDREQADLNKQQIGFIEFLLMPMYSCLADVSGAIILVRCKWGH